MTEITIITSEDTITIPVGRVGVLSGTGQSQGLTTDLSLLVDGDTVATLIDVVDRPPAIIRDRNPDAEDTARDSARGAQTVIVEAADNISVDKIVYGVESWTVEQHGQRDGDEQFQITLSLVPVIRVFDDSRVTAIARPRNDGLATARLDSQISAYALPDSDELITARLDTRVTAIAEPESDELVTARLDARVTAIAEPDATEQTGYGTAYGSAYGTT